MISGRRPEGSPRRLPLGLPRSDTCEARTGGMTGTMKLSQGVEPAGRSVAAESSDRWPVCSGFGRKHGRAER